MTSNKQRRAELKQLQSLPLDMKIDLTKQRIREWDYRYMGAVYLSWSGGKDSTVLRHIAMQEIPDIPCVFVNTGLEYPEIQKFVRDAKERGENVEILYPKMRFPDVIKKYGYPIISKEVSSTIYGARKSIEAGNMNTVRVRQMMGLLRNGEDYSDQYNHEKYRPLMNADFKISDRCCRIMKKGPAYKYDRKTGRKPITAQMACESKLRLQTWIVNGCNGFDMKNPISNPMSFWTEQDVLQYIKEYNVEIPNVYGDIVYGGNEDQMHFDECGGTLCTTGCKRTGCIYCAYGAHLEKQGEHRFLRLKETHPKQYKYCIGGGEYNDDGIWVPSKDGLGMGHVFDVLNEIYGKDFIPYK